MIRPPSGLAAQHRVIGGFQRDFLHQPGNPQLFQRCDHAGERGHKVVLVVEFHQHRPADPGDHRARGVTVEGGCADRARNIGHQMILDHRDMPLHAGRRLALGHAVDVAQTEDVGIADMAQRRGIDLDPALIKPFRAVRQPGFTHHLRRPHRRDHVHEIERDRFLAREASRLIEREQVRLQHILIALPENPTPEQVKRAEDKAKGLVERLRSGADFAAVAVRESDGRNALEGGDLGWFEMGAVPSLVSDLAYTLAEGEVSEPLRSPSGFHIIRMREIKAAAPEDV
ncbi:hypothetical protein EOM89_06400, partial [Candidatus Falkowbacteria bacterium]|nr:hypothetical protein [Candidatus Falkowbacteria bacterium]